VEEKRPNRWIVVITAALFLLGVFACTFGPAGSAKPTVVITYPQPGTEFWQGEELVIQSVSATAGAKGITRVELWVDGQLVHSQPVAPPVTSYTASQPWVPGVLGTHIVEVRSYNEDNVGSDPAQISLSVVPPGGPGTPAPPPPPPTATGAPVVTDQVTGQAMVTARIGLNIRSGPGVEYEVIGGLREGDSAQIAGKNADGSWWQIVYPANSGGRGWVSARSQYSTATNAGSVPVVAVPPPPAPQPTSTMTAPPPPPPSPSQTPVPPGKPVIYHFTADRYSITAGESATLSWDLANALEAHLYYDSIVQGVVAPGNKTVSPAVTTTYKLVAHNAAGDTTAYVTITVGPAGPPGVVMDFIASAPSAAWTSDWGANVLPWNGPDSDPRGFVKWRDGALLEDGSTAPRVLETHPQWVADGHIFGDYTLPRPIQVGDRFKSRVGFLQGAGGDVNFAVVVMGGSVSMPATMATVNDSGPDGVLRTIDVDLSPAAGGTHIVLVVEAGPSPGQDWAIWQNARLEH
jgi:uncharacterized protein YgiM (DUF1202 family)